MNHKLLFLLAAMLLMSVSAFAQSDEPLRGDVNGDGKVDVADITAIIAIIKNHTQPETTYYWYVGTSKPTSDTDIENHNITTTSELTEIDITDSNDYQYFAWPKTWGEPSFIDKSNNLPLSMGKVASLNDAFDNNTNSKYNCRRLGKNTGDITLLITWTK